MHARRATIVLAPLFAVVAVAFVDAHAVAAPQTSRVLAFVRPSKCPAGMVFVTGGSYTQSAGTIGGPKTIGSLCVDVTEVTVGAYATCSSNGACTPAWNTCIYPLWSGTQIVECGTMCNGGKPDRFDHPVNCVDFAQANAYCHAVGKRLPEQDEWEWVARGGANARTYPWGETEPDGIVCWSGPPDGIRTTTCAVGSYASGDNAQGIHDLAGNVQEWTTSKWPLGTEELRLTKGGTWAATVGAPLRVDNVNADPPLNRHNALGFRCVKDV